MLNKKKNDANKSESKKKGKKHENSTLIVNL